MSGASPSQDLQSDAARARGLGAAGHGSEHFWQQRVSALANIPLGLGLLVVLFAHRNAAHAELADLFRMPAFALLVLLAVLSFCWHMRLGLQMVIGDYVHAPLLKGAALIANDGAAFLIALASLWALLRLNFGG